MAGGTIGINASTLTFPVQVQCKDDVASVRPMESRDQAAVVAVARGFPSHDLLFLRRDITQPSVVAQWLEDQGPVLEGRGGAR